MYRDGLTQKALDAASEDYKTIIVKHLKLSGDVHKWYNIRDFLIEEMHKKKSTLKRMKYHIVDSLAKQYYLNVLFSNRKGNSSWDGFPSAFKCDLEEVLFLELPTNACAELRKIGVDLIDVYYGHEDKEKSIKFDEFDQEEWKLQEGTTFQDNDIKVLRHFINEFLYHMDDWIKIIEESIGKKKAAGCRKVYKKLEKRFSKIA